MGNIRDQFDKILENALNLTSATIRKNGNQWCVYSKSGKNMGCYPTRKQAEDRLKKIEMFKHMNK